MRAMRAMRLLGPKAAGIPGSVAGLGLAHERWNTARHSVATFVSAAVVIGNISFPVAVLTGFIK